MCRAAARYIATPKKLPVARTSGHSRIVDTEANLLIVDDDPEIRAMLVSAMRKEGFAASAAADGPAMRRELERAPFDLIILDLNLPGESGLTLCRDVRANSQVPIVMLTARGEPIDRIVGLEMGADDYLAKPFEPRELLARIRNVLRRSRAMPVNLEPLTASRASFAGWTLDFQHRQLSDETGRVTMLSGMEFRLLRLFIDYANRVLSREQLLDLGAVPQGDANDRAIDLQVSRLRARFGAQGSGLIRTVRYEGYVLAAAVTLV
jgi:two-component system, OmpR family, response regulator